MFTKLSSKLIPAKLVGLTFVLLAFSVSFAVSGLERQPVRNGYYLPWDKKYNPIEVGRSTHGLHNGYLRYQIDFSLQKGTPVLAIKQGEVINSLFMSGNEFRGVVVIDHKDGYCSLYAHLLNEEDYFLPFGDNGYTSISRPVKRGEIIGYSGIGAGVYHLHLSLFKSRNGSCAYQYNHERENSYPIYFEEYPSINSTFFNTGHSVFSGDDRIYFPGVKHDQLKVANSQNSTSTPPPDSFTVRNYRTFTDVTLDNKYFGYVEYLVDIGAITKASTFGLGSITKGQFVKMLMIAKDIPIEDRNTGCVFKDVCYGHTFYKYIKKCKDLKICEGETRSNGKYFDPDKMVNRYIAAKFVTLARDAKEPANCTTNPYSDVPKGDTFCKYVTRYKKIFSQENEIFVSGNVYSGDTLISRPEAAWHIVVGLGLKPQLPKFWDVWTDSTYYDWVMQNFREGVINGCSSNMYCGSDTATPGQLSKMIVESMGEYRKYPLDYKPFKDVPTSDTFYHYIRRLVELGKGTGMFDAAPQHPFGTNDKLTRYRAVEMIVWSLQIKGFQCDLYMPQRFADVAPNNDYYSEVQCAAQYGITDGKTDKLFHGNDYTNRYELAKMIAIAFSYRFQDSHGEESGGNTPKDCRSSSRAVHLNPNGEAYLKIKGEETECYTVVDSVLASASSLDTNIASISGSTENRLVSLSPTLLGVNVNLTLELLDANQKLIKKISNVSAFNPAQVEWNTFKDNVRYINITNTSTGTKSNYAYFSVEVESSVCNMQAKVCASAGTDPVFAIDGNPGTYWEARGFAPQWLEIDLSSVKPFYGLNISLDQSPAGESSHTVYVAGENRLFEEYHTFTGYTKGGSQLKFTTQDAHQVRFVRIVSTQSPSWISYQDVKLFLEQPEIYRTWDGLTNLEQGTTACQGTTLAVYLVQKGDGTKHTIVHRIDAPEAWDHSLITDQGSHSLKLNGCEVRLTQGTQVAVHRIEPTTDPTYAWKIVFLTMQAPTSEHFRTWEGIQNLEQKQTTCNATQLFVYLVRKQDNTKHIIVHRANAPEVWDHTLITDGSSHSLMLSGCEIRLTQGTQFALHNLVETGDPTYAWRIEFVRMEPNPTVVVQLNNGTYSLFLPTIVTSVTSTASITGLDNEHEEIFLPLITSFSFTEASLQELESEPTTVETKIFMPLIER